MTTYIRLLPVEDFFVRRGESRISTLTWFQGDHQQAAASLQERLEEVVQANIWLTGRIVRHQLRNHLVYNKNNKYDSKSDTKDDNLFRHLSPEDSPFARNTPVEELATIAHNNSLTIPSSGTQLLFQLSIVPCQKSPQKHFAVVVSLSHVACDGHTFYTLYNMLMGTQDVQVMKVARVATTMQQQADLVGKGELRLGRSIGVVLPAIFGLVVGKLLGICFDKYRIRQRYFWVDQEKMEVLKQAAAKAIPQGNDADLESPVYCSSNDVIASWLFAGTKCRHGLMAVDLRRRLDGHTPLHAGNYAFLHYYHNSKDCATPGLIRQSIPNLKRFVTSTTRLPPVLMGGIAIVTNWSSFPTDAAVNLAPGCQEELHLPLYTAAAYQPSNVVGACVFRGRSGQLAMFVSGTRDQLDALKDCDFEGTEIVG